VNISSKGTQQALYIFILFVIHKAPLGYNNIIRDGIVLLSIITFITTHPPLGTTLDCICINSIN
jgi:hypothetical protein